MTELRKAAEMALEALEYYRSFEDCQPTPASKTIPALRQALAEPKHEPVVGTKTWVEDGKVFTQNLYASDIYKAPPKREWVGLTDQEIENLWNQHESRFDHYSFSCDIEAKLKEKNGG